MKSKGVLIGWKGKETHFFDKDAHILTIAQSGAGKNTSIIMPNLLMDKFQGTKIILDMKGENASVCSHWKEEQKLGKSYYINPWRIFDMPTLNYNPFCTLDAYNNTLYEDCAAFAECILPEKPSASDTGEHFDELARDFITSFLMYLTIKYQDRDDPKTPTPVDLYDNLIKHTATVDDLAKLTEQMRLITHPDPYIKRALDLSAMTLQSATTSGENGELRGIKTTIARAFRSFKSRSLAQAVEASETQSKHLINNLFYNNKGHNDLYISFPQSDLKQARVWLRLILTSFIRTLIRNPSQQPVLFVLDEFPQLGTFNLIKDNVAFLRGYGVRFWFIGQNIAQFKANYGEEGMQTIFENCMVKQFFNIEDETARYVSQKLGKISIPLKDSYTREFKGTHHEDLMSQTDIEQSKEMAIFITGEKPLKLEKKAYYNVIALNERAKPNPLYYNKLKI